MEPSVSSSLVNLDTAKQVWDKAKDMFSGVGNLRYTYDLHQVFFSHSLDDLPLEAFYDKLCSIREEIVLSVPITFDISVMKQQRGSCGLLVFCMLSCFRLMVFAPRYLEFIFCANIFCEML